MLDLRGVAPELLPQPDRGRVHQVRAPDLDDVAKLGGLRLEGRRQFIKGGPEPGAERNRDAHMQRGWDEVVRRLAEVDVVVRMQGLL